MSRDLSRLGPDRLENVRTFEKIPHKTKPRTESKHERENERDRARRAKWAAKTHQGNNKTKGR